MISGKKISFMNNVVSMLLVKACVNNLQITDSRFSSSYAISVTEVLTREDSMWKRDMDRLVRGKSVTMGWSDAPNFMARKHSVQLGLGVRIQISVVYVVSSGRMCL